MAQFDVYRIRNKSGFFLSLQHDVLADTVTTVVAPLKPRSELPHALSRLNPVLAFDGGEFVLVTQSIGTVPNDWLIPANFSVAADRYSIIAALDFLFTGV